MRSTVPRRSVRRQQAVIAGVAVLMAAAGIGVPLGRHLTQPTLQAPDRVPAYQVTYRVTNLASGAPATDWELLTVRRPFSSSDLVYGTQPAPGAPSSGGTARSGTIFTEDALYVVQQGAVRPVAGRQPGPGGDDQDLGTQLPDLESRGLARDLGVSRHVAGTDCRVYRFAGPPSGALARVSGTDHDDICLDARGIELGEDWTYHGRLVVHRVAVALRTSGVTDPIPSAAVQAAGRPRPGSGAPFSEPVPDATSFLPAPPVPDGFRPAVVERFAEPDPQNPQTLLATSVVWAFAEGPDVITVEAGQGAPGQLPWGNESTSVEQVTLTHLGAAETALRSDGAEVHVDLGNGRWLRIRGTVPVSGLVVYADSVRSPA